MRLSSPVETTASFIVTGVKKAALSPKKMFILAILAGVYIGLGACLYTLITTDLARFLGVGFAKLLGGFVFSLGLILVVFTGAELFTGNNLMVISLLHRKITIAQVLNNWVIVYFGNLIGSFLLVLVVISTGLDTLWGKNAVAIANAKVTLPFLQAFSRGILCNFLVCLAVWLSAVSKDAIGKFLGIVFPVTAFVASGFEHSIANMYFIPMGILLKSRDYIDFSVANLNWNMMVFKNIIPVTAGNIIGGTIFVGFLFWYIHRSDFDRAGVTNINMD